jgi:hypothetical protein
MLKDEIDEQMAPDKSSYPPTSPLAIGKPFTGLQETIPIKETREVVVQDTHFMLIYEAAQSETKQELAENIGFIMEHDTNGKKEEAREVVCGVSC